MLERIRQCIKFLCFPPFNHAWKPAMYAVHLRGILYLTKALNLVQEETQTCNVFIKITNATYISSILTAGPTIRAHVNCITIRPLLYPHYMQTGQRSDYRKANNTKD